MTIGRVGAAWGFRKATKQTGGSLDYMLGLMTVMCWLEGAVFFAGVKEEAWLPREES